MEAPETYHIGINNELLRINSRTDCQKITLALANQANQNLVIFSHDLEPDLYNSILFADALRALMARSHQAIIRILASNISPAIQQGHRLLDLSKRQPSRIQIRKLNRSYHHAFLIADETAVLDRRRAERFEATANFNDPGWAAELLHFFDGCWEKSQTSLESLNSHL